MAAETPLPTRTTANSRAQHVADHNELHDRANTRIPAANPTGVTIQEMTDPVGGGTMKVVSFPADQAAIAIMVDGDAYPRWIFASDSTDGLYMGDGTYDPYNDGAYIAVFGDLRIGAPSGDNDVSLRPSGTGVVTTTKSLVVTGHLDVDNAVATGTVTPGTCVGKMEIFRHGASLGFIPIYDAIT